MTIRTDQREIRAESDPEGLALVGRTLAELLDVQIRAAKALLRIDRSRAYAHEGSASLTEFAARHGSDPHQTRVLRDLALALEAVKGLEEEVRTHLVPLSSASLLGELHRQGGVRPGDDWRTLAHQLSISDFRRRVRLRIAEVQQKTALVTPATFFLTDETLDEFDRARTIASRKAGETLTRERTLETVLDHYLDTFDPERNGEGTGTRRRARFPGKPRNRYVPAEVRRRLREIFGDRCCVPGCENKIYVEKAHRRAFARGGKQGVRNLLPMCHAHHTLYDAGWIWVREWRKDGRVVFETKDGWSLHPVRPILRRVPPRRGAGPGSAGRPARPRGP